MFWFPRINVPHANAPQIYANTGVHKHSWSFLQISQLPPASLAVLQQILPAVLLATAPGRPAMTLKAPPRARLEVAYFAHYDPLSCDIAVSTMRDVRGVRGVSLAVSLGISTYLLSPRVRMWVCSSWNHPEATAEDMIHLACQSPCTPARHSSTAPYTLVRLSIKRGYWWL